MHQTTDVHKQFSPNMRNALAELREPFEIESIGQYLLSHGLGLRDLREILESKNWGNFSEMTRRSQNLLNYFRTRYYNSRNCR